MTKKIDISKMNKLELIEKYKELGILKCSSKNKSQLIELIHSIQLTPDISDSCIENMIENNKIILPIGKLPPPDCKIINYIDLCCGIGGFRVALESFQKKTNIKFNCVLSADIKEDAIKTYNLNFNENNKKKKYIGN